MGINSKGPQRLLVTGGCGFVGSHVAVAFRQDGWNVTCLDNLSRRGSEFTSQRVVAEGCRFVHADMRNYEDLTRIEGAFDLIIECSAEPSVQMGQQGRDALFMVNNNLMGTVVCLEYARQHHIPFIFMSTSRVYPHAQINALCFRETSTRYVLDNQAPGVSARGISSAFPLNGARTLYGATKLSSELLIAEFSALYDIPAIINRCGVVAGPWQMGKVDQGFVTYWVANHYFGKPLSYIGYGGTGKQVRDVLHIDDLVLLLKKQSEDIARFRGDIFQVGGGAANSVSLCELTKLCRERTGREVEVMPVQQTRPGDVIWYVTDNGNTQTTFGWTPERDATTIVADTFRWMKEHEAAVTPFFNR